MLVSLPHYPWKISYASDTGNPIAKFYSPALERSIQYDRKSKVSGELYIITPNFQLLTPEPAQTLAHYWSPVPDLN